MLCSFNYFFNPKIMRKFKRWYRSFPLGLTRGLRQPKQSVRRCRVTWGDAIYEIKREGGWAVGVMVLIVFLTVFLA